MEVTNEPINFILPQMCLKCLGPAEESYLLETSYSSGGEARERHVTVFKLNVPICARCLQGIRRMKQASVALLMIFALGCGLLSLIFKSWDTLFIVAGIILGLVAWGGLRYVSQPAKVTKRGLPFFYNPDYQSKFQEANDLSPKSYSLIDKLPNKW